MPELHAHVVEDLLGAPQGQRKGVGAEAAGLDEVDAGMRVVALVGLIVWSIDLHAGVHVADLEPVRVRGDGGVVFHQEAAGVVGVGTAAAVTEPEEVPFVAIGAVGWSEGGTVGRRRFQQVVGREGKVDELAAEVDVPVRVVFEDERGRDAVRDYVSGEVEVRAPGADDLVPSWPVFEGLSLEKKNGSVGVGGATDGYGGKGESVRSLEKDVLRGGEQ